MTAWLVALVTIAQAAVSPDASHPQQLDSGTSQVHLVELFTSEGCSSCPPADRWLQTYIDHESLWNDVVPVAFHVDYWDYLGWQDPFAHSQHTARQRQYARQGHTSGVYTPGFFVDGEEWRGFFSRRSLNPKPAKAPRLTTTIENQQVTVNFAANNLQQPVATVAILGFDLQTQIPRGENRGKRLSHDFVVLGLEQQNLNAGPSGYSGTLRLPASRRPSQRQAIAVWVSDQSQQPLQAVGGWLEGP
ncbi:MAG: DUF1223 domain-containing protein [Lysobacterales bacterium]